MLDYFIVFQLTIMRFIILKNPLSNILIFRVTLISTFIHHYSSLYFTPDYSFNFKFLFSLLLCLPFFIALYKLFAILHYLFDFYLFFLLEFIPCIVQALVISFIFIILSMQALNHEPCHPLLHCNCIIHVCCVHYM